MRKQQRREKVKKNLEAQLVSGVKPSGTEKVPLSAGDRVRISKEIKTLTDRLSGIKKQQSNKPQQQEVSQDKWVIDIYSITYGYAKRSERRKNKGKSRKKLRRVKTVSLLRTIVAQPGMIENYRQGRGGISPKTHKFTLRKEEPTFL